MFVFVVIRIGAVFIKHHGTKVILTENLIRIIVEVIHEVVWITGKQACKQEDGFKSFVCIIGWFALVFFQVDVLDHLAVIIPFIIEIRRCKINGEIGQGIFFLVIK